MHIPMEWHPFELKRRVQLLISDLQDDLDLRFPDTRKRIAMELRLNLPAGDRKRFNNLINRFQKAKRSISFFDWGLLIEWNERRRQAETLSLIVHEISSTHVSSFGDQKLGRTLLDRLDEILTEIRSHTLKPNPSLWMSLNYRWKFSALRHETLYLVNRLRHLRQPQVA